MVVWGFEIGDRHLRFRRFCIKIIIKGIQKSEITDCDTGGCGMWVLKFIPIQSMGTRDPRLVKEVGDLKIINHHQQRNQSIEIDADAEFPVLNAD